MNPLAYFNGLPLTVHMPGMPAGASKRGCRLRGCRSVRIPPQHCRPAAGHHSTQRSTAAMGRQSLPYPRAQRRRRGLQIISHQLPRQGIIARGHCVQISLNPAGLLPAAAMPGAENRRGGQPLVRLDDNKLKLWEISHRI